MGWTTINGQHVFINEEGVLEFHPSTKMKRALDSTVKTTKVHQAIADASERILSKSIGIPRTPDNAAFDLRTPDTGIEVKTLIHGKNGKITMSKAAIGRKLAEQSAEGIEIHTVVVDRRAAWNSGNAMGNATYYYRKGVGSFQLSAMKQVSLAELKEIVRP